LDRTAASKVLAAVCWTVEENPHAWPKVPGTERLYMAKTRRVTSAAGFVPMLRILFTVEDSHEVVLRQADSMDFFL